MNDIEFADLMMRAQAIEGLTGKYPSNAYTCPLCLKEGETEMGATYLDYPHSTDGLCHRHAVEEGRDVCGRDI